MRRAPDGCSGLCEAAFLQASLSALTDAHTDWGFKEVSATDHPGVYRLDFADAVFATGAWSAVVTITGTGLDPTSIEFVLVAQKASDVYSRLGAPAGASISADLAAVQSTLDSAPTAADVATAVQTSASTTPLPANVKKINDVAITGDGSASPFSV